MTPHATHSTSREGSVEFIRLEHIDELPHALQPRTAAWGFRCNVKFGSIITILNNIIIILQHDWKHVTSFDNDVDDGESAYELAHAVLPWMWPDAMNGQTFHLVSST
jgi:hypothetical protein